MSDPGGIIAHVFEQVLDPQVAARFDENIERCYPSKTAPSAALIERICAMSRVENRAAAAQLVAIGELFGYRLACGSETEDWAIETMEAGGAVGAAGFAVWQGEVAQGAG